MLSLTVTLASAFAAGYLIAKGIHALGVSIGDDINQRRETRQQAREQEKNHKA